MTSLRLGSAESKGSFHVRANMFNREFRVPVLRHLVHQQLKWSQRDSVRRILAEDGSTCLSNRYFMSSLIFLPMTPPSPMRTPSKALQNSRWILPGGWILPRG